MKNYLIVFLVFLCVFLGLYVKFRQKNTAVFQIQNAAMAEGLQKQIILHERILTQKTRLDGGGVQAQTSYLPPEGGFNISQSNEGEIKLEIKNKGFTLRPFAGALLTQGGNADIAIGARFAYWQRYGLGAAWAAQNGPQLVLDRRLDDILPLHNTSLMLFLGRRAAGAGIAVYL